MKVTGLGQCAWDYLAVIDKYPEVDTKKEIIEWEEEGGGPVATALVALSRLGIKCEFLGLTGDDPEGTLIRKSLAEENIDTSSLKVRSGTSSQLAFILIEKVSGKRTIFWKRPQGNELATTELPPDFLHGSNFLLLDGLMKEVSFHAATIANEKCVPVMLDAGRLRDGMLELARICDYVVGSEEFARELGWDGNIKRFRKILKNSGLGLTTITLGEKGSITFLENNTLEVPAYKVDAVDTTGAGDVFHAGYIYGLMEGWNIEKIITFATAFAALKCQKVGGRRGIPSLKKTMNLIKKGARHSPASLL